MGPELTLGFTHDDAEIIGDYLTNMEMPGAGAIVFADIHAPELRVLFIEHVVGIRVIRLLLADPAINDVTILVRDEIACHRRVQWNALTSKNDVRLTPVLLVVI